MTNPELIAYIRAEVAKGLPADVIKANLRLGGGWTDGDIAEAFQVVGVTLPSALQGVPLSPTQNSMPEQPVVPDTVLPISNPVPSPAIETISPQSVPQEQVSNQESIRAYNANIINSINLGNSQFSGNKYLSKNILLVAGILLLVILGSGGVYALVARMGLLSSNPYNEKNFISGLLTKATEINSSAYVASVSVRTLPREEGAKPFSIVLSNKDELEKKYKNDAQRARDIEELLYSIRYSKNGYPKTLQETLTSNTYYTNNISIKDPKTGKQYRYEVTGNGTNFTLSADFETKDAIDSAKKSYGYNSANTPIKNQTITFTKDSSPVYLSGVAPKPFLVTLQESSAFAPAEFSADASIGATADLKKADWKFNIGASGDFGDLSYKVNVDFLRKDKTYYFRINNIPSIFLGSFPVAKGEWVKISSTATTTDSYDPISSYAAGIPKAEESYKKNKDEFMRLFKKTIEIADSNELIAFKSNPKQETINERKLYRYDLTLKKESIVPFYKELIQEVENGNYKTDEPLIVDKSLLDYLQTPEFDQVFDYVNDNTSLTVWVDTEGFPAILEYSMRLVPPDTALQLKDKQVTTVFKLAINDINKNVTIDAPKTTKTLEDIVGASLKEARANGANAEIKSNLANIRANAELYYDSHNGKYGTANTKGSCTAKNTVFTDSAIVKSLSDAQKASGENRKAVCYSTATAWALSLQLAAPQNEKGHWCVDSNGNSELVSKSITKTSCR